MKDQRGFSLIEIIIAMAILSIISIGLFSSLGLATRILASTNSEESARDIAVAEMEHIKRLPYQSGVTSYSTPSGVTNHVTYPDPENLEKQRITVSVEYTAHRAEEIITRNFILEGYKVNR